jgi:hypothetical protein
MHLVFYVLPDMSVADVSISGTLADLLRGPTGKSIDGLEHH